MPQITVEYSAAVADTFDRPEFAVALHGALADVADASVEGCKTRFHRLDECVIGDGATGKAMVHVRVGLLSGRTGDTKRAVSEAVQDVLGKHLRAVPGVVVQLTAEVVDMEYYTKRVV